MALLVGILAATFLPLGIAAAEPVRTPRPGTPERKAILDGVRPAVSEMLEQKQIVFVVERLLVADGWAWLHGRPQTPDASFQYEDIRALVKRDGKAGNKWRMVRIMGMEPSEAEYADDEEKQEWEALKKKFPDLPKALIDAALAPTHPQAEVDEILRQIRADYAATENAKLTKRSIKTEDTGMVAELAKYFRGDNLVKMVHESGSDHTSATDRYYFKDGRLYFIHQSGGHWRFDPAGGEGATIDTGWEQRIYFHDGKVIRHLVKEAQSRDSAAVPKLLAKAPNKPTDDPEAANGLASAGHRLLKVNTRAQLEEFHQQE